MVQPLNGFPEGWQAPVGHASKSGGGLLDAKFGEDRLLNVRFYMHPYVDEFKTQQNAENGIFKKELFYKEHVRIQPLGDTTMVFDQPCTNSHKARFPQQYEAFRSGTQAKIGIPLEAWDYQLSETEILTFKLLGIEFVHQIVAMNETQQNSLGNSQREIVARAKITCAEVSEKEAATELQAKFDELQKQLQEQKEDNRRMFELMEQKSNERREMEARDIARKPGRPAKIKDFEDDNS